MIGNKMLINRETFPLNSSKVTWKDVAVNNTKVLVTNK